MKLAVVGLGYVGLPLAVAFGKVYPTYGFDTSGQKISAYRNSVDPSGSITGVEFAEATKLSFHEDPAVLKDADFIVVAVPTPVDEANQPDLSLLERCCEMIAKHLKPGATVVFESTVYPGVTEDTCIPILEKVSGLTWKVDFSVGYSPERVSPGDKLRTVTKILKIVSGDSPETCERVADVYSTIIEPGVYRASSIKVAEAAKVMENTQRDLNIALMNELAIIFHRVGIDSIEVIEAAKTKWNFMPFYPGLVGGHCIGVDPYYMTHKAEMLGYHPQVISAGRRVNDGMATYVARMVVKQLAQAGQMIKGAKVIVLGLTFKENCTDLRNSKVADLVAELLDFGCDVHVHDPVADRHEALEEYGIATIEWGQLPNDAATIIAAVPHAAYSEMSVTDLVGKLQPGGLFVDLKSRYDASAIAAKGFQLWRL